MTLSYFVNSTHCLKSSTILSLLENSTSPIFRVKTSFQCKNDIAYIEQYFLKNLGMLNLQKIVVLLKCSNLQNKTEIMTSNK